MACNSRENAINYLIKQGVISDTNEVLDIDKFNISNSILTNFAKDQYNLNNMDNMLFKLIKKDGKYIAEPDFGLFDTLDQLIDYEETKEANQRPPSINESEIEDQPMFMRTPEVEYLSEEDLRKIASFEQVESVASLIMNKLSIKERPYQTRSKKKVQDIIDAEDRVLETMLAKDIIENIFGNIQLPYYDSLEELINVLERTDDSTFIKLLQKQGVRKQNYYSNLLIAERQALKELKEEQNILKKFLTQRDLINPSKTEIEIIERNFPALFKENRFKSIDQGIAFYQTQRNILKNIQNRIKDQNKKITNTKLILKAVDKKIDTAINFVNIIPNWKNLLESKIVNETNRLLKFKKTQLQKYSEVLQRRLITDLYNNATQTREMTRNLEIRETKGPDIKKITSIFPNYDTTRTVRAISDTTTVLKNIINSDSKFADVAEKLLPYAQKHNILIGVVPTDYLDRLDAAGQYIASTKALDSEQSYIDRELIQLNYESDSFLFNADRLVLHEIIHSLSTIAINDIAQKFSNKGKIDPYNQLLNYVINEVNKRKESRGYKYSFFGGNEIYGFTNVDELFSETLTNPYLQDLLKQIPPMEKGEFRNLFEEILNFIAKLFNIDKYSNVYEQLEDVIYGTINTQLDYLLYYDQVINSAKEDIEDITSGKSQANDPVIGKDAKMTPDTSKKRIEDVLSKLDSAKALTIAETMAERLRVGIGISYQVIDKETAVKILENSPIKYNGEPAFVYANTIYIIQGNMNLNNVLHEFAHPLISAIRATPATRQLFENLYSQVKNTDEGKTLIEKVRSLYPELIEDTILFKEEVIVHALQQNAYNIVNDQVESKGFEAFIKNLLYAIKQILRRVFGDKVKVSKLNVNTTLEELAEMMISKEFDFGDMMTAKEIPQFIRSEKQRIDKLDDTAKKIAKDISADTMIKVINLFYTNTLTSINQKRRLRKDSPEYKMLEKSILEEDTNEYLPKVKELLKGYQTVDVRKGKSREELVDNALLSEIEELEYLTRQATSLVHSFNTINNISESIVDDLLEIKNNKNLGSRSVMTLVSIYQNLIAGWQDLVYNTDQMMVKDFGIRTDNPFTILLGSINTNLTRANTILKDVFKESSVNFYKEYTGYMHEFVEGQLKSNLMRSLKKIKQPLTNEEIEDFYNKIIDDSLSTEDMNALVERGANKKFVQDFIREYDTFKIDETKIRDLLSGKLDDVNWFNRFLEAYTSSNDPIVGGLAVYLQNVRTDAMNEALQESEKFRNKLGPALEAVGFNKLSTRQLLKLTTFEDSVGVFNDKDEIVPHLVHTFFHEFKGYRFDERVLENNYQQARETGDPIKIAEAARQLRKWKMDYMWDYYLPEVYEADELFESEIGKLAWLDRQTILDKLKTETSKYQDELERFDKYTTAQAIMKEYRSLFELTYVDGSPKIDDPEKGIYDLSKAQILREYREKSRKYKTFIPKEGSLQTAYNQFVNLLISQNVKRNDPEFDEKLKEWEKQNLRIAYSESYLENRRKDIARVRELNAKRNESTTEDYDTAAAFDEIYNLLYLNRDEQGQPIPSELGPDKLKRIKVLEQEIYDFTSTLDKKMGLTKPQLEELKRYEATIDGGGELSPIQKKRYVSLLEKQNSGLTPSELTELNSLYTRLGEQSVKIPTDYYMTTMNYYLNKLGQPETTPEKVDELINSAAFIEVLYSDNGFKNWFLNSHIEKEVFKKNKFVISRERTRAYSITIPKNTEDILTTTVIDETTGKEVTFTGTPNARHLKYVVKDEFRTIPRGQDWENYIGIFKDPAGNWLPRQHKPGTKNSAVDSKYINEEYLKMKGTPQYQLTELIKDFMIDIQKELPISSRTGYDMPRFFLDNKLEMLQGTNISEVASQIKGSFKTWIDDNFRNSQEAEFERSHNFNPKQLLVNTDLLGQEISYVPIRGVYKIDIDKVSPDVIRSIFRYQASGILQKKLIESASLVEGILETLDDPSNAPKDPTKANRQKFKIEGVLESISKSKSKTYNRREQVRSLLLRELQGKNVVGIEESNPWLFKLTNFMQRTAGMATLAVNIPSDLKNRYGQIVQNIIEATGGQFLNLQSLALGKVFASKAMVEWSAKGIYAKGGQSLTVQLIQRFDPVFKTEKEYGKSVGRSMIKDLVDGSWMYDFRKFGEMEAALQLFGGMMHHKYVDQKTKDGTIIPIRYIDAFELDEDGVIKLKEGIDPEWGFKSINHIYIEGETLKEIADRYHVTVEDLKAKNQIKDESSLETGTELIIAKGAKYKQFKNQIQAVSRQLYGNYDEFGQPEGNMYLAYRMFFFMRKWATTGFLKRFGMSTKKGNWGGKRYDWALGQPTRGYYITSFMAGFKLLKSWGDYYNYMDEQDKADVKRFIGEGFTTLFLGLAGLLLFGYDPDDEDRFNKLAEKSGPMFTPDFKLRGFMTNHMLYLMLGVYQETSTYAPIPGLGLDEYSKFMSVTSTSFNSTIKIYMKIFEDIVNMIFMNDSAYYKRDVGPYSWQKEGSAKILTHMLSVFGLSGRSGDAEKLIENMEKYGRI